MSKEKVVRFGSSGTLVGIVTDPAELVPGRPAFLILNAGVLHRVGPARLHVRLARKLAAAGFTALRFDFSGIGDSEPSKEAAAFDARAVREIQQAMDFLSRTRGMSQFVLFGLCSGADAAFLAANADPRIVGHVQIDGLAYRTLGYYLHYYGPRLLRVRSWLGFGRRALLAVGRRLRGFVAPRQSRGPAAPTFGREFPPRAQAAAQLGALAQRGVHQFFIYSAGHERWYNHAGQFERIFGDVDFRGRLRVRYFGEADHTFPDLRQQDMLTTVIRDWASGTWPPSNGNGSTQEPARRAAAPTSAYIG